MKRERIAVIVPGGVGKEQYIPSLVQVLQRLSASYTLRVYSYTACELHPVLAGQGIRLTVPPEWCRRQRMLSFVYFVFALYRDHRIDAFALLHAYWVSPSGVTAWTVKVLLGLRWVLTLPGGDTVYVPSIHYGGMASPLRRALIRLCCGAADSTVVLSEYQRTLAGERGVHVKRATIIPFGVDTAQFYFHPKPISAPLRLISIGSINRVKDVFLQIETIALLRHHIDCRLTIVGGDVLAGEALRYAESLHAGSVIDWKGHCAHAAIPSLLHRAHVLVHTPLYEAEGVVVMEAFAAGTVVVGTRAGLLADCDCEGECTIGARDPVLLSQKILSIIGDPGRIGEIRARNRRYAERTAIDRTASAYASVYDDCITARD